MKKFKSLVDGETYWSRNGGRVKVTENGYGSYPFSGNNGCTYTAEGRYMSSFDRDYRDLIFNWEEGDAREDVLRHVLRRARARLVLFIAAPVAVFFLSVLMCARG